MRCVGGTAPATLADLLLVSQRSSTAKHGALCKEYAVEALANLVNANVDPAFHRFTEMGTVPDVGIRAAYLQSTTAFPASFVAVRLAD